MDTTTSSHIATPQPRTGLALASLILGIFAVVASLLVVGGLLGVLASLLAAFHIILRRGPNGMAWSGLALGLLSLALSAGLAFLYVKGVQKFRGQLDTRQQTASVEEGIMEDWIGVEAPDLTVQSLDGETFRLSDLKGRRVILDFWATWCPPCRLEIPHFVQLAEENPRDKLLIVGISSEDEATLKEFLAEQEINYPIVSTDALPAPFDSIEAIPTTFFIDRRGIIQDIIVGYHDYDALKERALAADTEGDPASAPGTLEEPGTVAE